MNDHEALKILKIQAENKHLRKEKLKLERILKLREKRLAEAYALLELKKSNPATEGKRGKLISVEVKSCLLAWVREAIKQGARKSRACQIVGISIRSIERWEKTVSLEDKRKYRVFLFPTIN